MKGKRTIAGVPVLLASIRDGLALEACAFVGRFVEFDAEDA